LARKSSFLRCHKNAAYWLKVNENLLQASFDVESTGARPIFVRSTEIWAKGRATIAFPSIGSAEFIATLSELVMAVTRSAKVAFPHISETV